MAILDLGFGDLSPLLRRTHAPVRVYKCALAKQGTCPLVRSPPLSPTVSPLALFVKHAVSMFSVPHLIWIWLMDGYSPKLHHVQWACVSAHVVLRCVVGPVVSVLYSLTTWSPPAFSRNLFCIFRSVRWLFCLPFVNLLLVVWAQEKRRKQCYLFRLWVWLFDFDFYFVVCSFDEQFIVFHYHPNLKKCIQKFLFLIDTILLKGIYILPHLLW